MLCDFKPHPFLSNAHLQTIVPHQFRNAESINYIRQRFELADGDFVDLDWSKNGKEKLCLLLHGLESSSDRGYIYGAIGAVKASYDCVVLNYRGCSGEANRLLKAYHSGKTDDLKEVLSYLSGLEQYKEIVLLGYSLGGNIALKYTGEFSQDLPSKLKKVIGISVPCDLASSSIKLDHWSNKIYHDRFLKSLKEKVVAKKLKFLEEIDLDKLESLKTIKAFDEYYTAPVNGFSSADEYYRLASSKPFLSKIKLSTLIITAKDDPFFTPDCMPTKEANENPNIIFLNPEKGGHVGFCRKIKEKIYWHEEKILAFLGA